MWCIEDLASHEVHGPFTSQTRAHEYAKLRGIKPYTLISANKAQQYHDPRSSRIVPAEYR